MSLERRFLAAMARSPLHPRPAAGTPIDAETLASLPEPARRYFGFMGVRGHPPVATFRAGWRGAFRRAVGAPWQRCEAWQFNSRTPVARIFLMELRMARIVPVIGRDTYADGHGRLRVRLFDALTVLDLGGEPMDAGEQVTWLDDAVLIAPGMLFGPGVTFAGAGPDAFEVALEDHGRTVRMRVVVDARGAPVDVGTGDRFLATGRDAPVRTPWSTPVLRWGEHDGRPVASAASALWHTPSGDFEYARFEMIPGSLAFDVAPGA
jgi:hypothetical protein